MDKLVGLVSTAPKTRSKNDDDFADRLSSRYTVVLLIVFAVLVGIIEVSNAGVTSEINSFMHSFFYFVYVFYGFIHVFKLLL